MQDVGTVKQETWHFLIPVNEVYMVIFYMLALLYTRGTLLQFIVYHVRFMINIIDNT